MHSLQYNLLPLRISPLRELQKAHPMPSQVMASVLSATSLMWLGTSRNRGRSLPWRSSQQSIGYPRVSRVRFVVWILTFLLPLPPLRTHTGCPFVAYPSWSTKIPFTNRSTHIPSKRSPRSRGAYPSKIHPWNLMLWGAILAISSVNPSSWCLPKTPVNHRRTILPFIYISGLTAPAQIVPPGSRVVLCHSADDFLRIKKRPQQVAHPLGFYPTTQWQRT